MAPSPHPAYNERRHLDCIRQRRSEGSQERLTALMSQSVDGNVLAGNALVGRAASAVPVAT
jgi:hypothetical protein